MMRKLFFALFFTTTILATDVIEDKTTLPLLNASLQKQKILKLQLDNGLKAIIVSDPEVEQASVAITMMAGNFYDPVDHPGLAHFLEHMLFLGTKEYPEESGFTRYLSAHGGENNAYTTGDYTSYIFSINSSGLPEALKRVSSFFKDPLFNPSGVERELNAIDQEFAQGYNKEGIRDYYVLKDLANPEHPASHFTSGNSKSLANTSPQDLRNWFDTHYSADRMRIFVQAPLPLDELRNMVEKDFGTIPDRKVEIKQIDVPVITPELEGHLIHLQSNKQGAKLSLLWELPKDVPGMLETKPDDLICYVLGHEAKGSLLSELKREGLVEEISCGTLELSTNTSFLALQVKLTEKGEQEQNTVIERVFQTLKRLKSEPYSQDLFNEYAEILKQRYEYQQKDVPFEWAMKQSGYLAKEDLSTYPELSQTIRRLDQNEINKLLAIFTPEHAIYIYSTPNGSFNKKEKWMGIPYSISPIAADVMQKWNSVSLNPAIQYPQSNAFVAQHFDLTPANFSRNDYPNLPPPKTLLDEPGVIAYFAVDPFYQVPRTYFRTQIQSAQIKESSPQAVVFTDLYVKAIQEGLCEIIYEAKMADIDIKIEHVQGAIQLTLDGFSESVEKFLPPFFDAMLALEIDEPTYNYLKDKLQKEYDNKLKDMPAKQTFDYFKGSVYADYTLDNQKRSAIKRIAYKSFQKFANQVLQKTFIKAMFTGSMTESEASKVIGSLHQKLHATPQSTIPLSSPKMISLTQEKGPIQISAKTDAEGDAALLVLQVNGFSPRLRNLQDILTNTLGDAFFTELRTKQQTGYIVASDALELERLLFNYFAVQSTTHIPNELLWRFEQFFENYLKNLKTENVTESRFETLRTSAATQLKNPPPTLKVYGEQQFKLAFEIQDFAWMKKRLEDIPSITYDDFITFTQDFLGRDNKRRFAILLDGKHKETAFGYTSIKSLRALK